jgi:hypothetical protein
MGEAARQRIAHYSVDAAVDGLTVAVEGSQS